MGRRKSPEVCGGPGNCRTIGPKAIALRRSVHLGGRRQGKGCKTRSLVIFFEDNSGSQCFRDEDQIFQGLG